MPKAGSIIVWSGRPSSPLGSGSMGCVALVLLGTVDGLGLTVEEGDGGRNVEVIVAVVRKTL
jgi:hypothetical protein